MFTFVIVYSTIYIICNTINILYKEIKHEKLFFFGLRVVFI